MKLTTSCAFAPPTEFIVGAPGGCATNTWVSVGAEKVRLLSALAPSLIDPEFKSRVVFIEMPSVSISSEEAATVYLKLSEFVPLPDT